jgi:hypothetical protein
MLLCRGEDRGLRAHHQHSAAPLAESNKELVTKCRSCSSSVRRGWEGIILPGKEDPHSLVDPHEVSESAGEITKFESWSV